jgi:hypothetical protein
MWVSYNLYITSGNMMYYNIPKSMSSFPIIDVIISHFRCHMINFSCVAMAICDHNYSLPIIDSNHYITMSATYGMVFFYSNFSVVVCKGNQEGDIRD